MNQTNYLEEEIRPWGKIYVIQDEANYKIKRIEVNPGQKLSYQYHNKRSETWTIVDGTGKITNYELIANVTFKIKSNKEIKFSEKKIIENLNDNFEQTKQETSVKQIFAKSMINKLITQLNIIQ